MKNTSIITLISLAAISLAVADTAKSTVTPKKRPSHADLIKKKSAEKKTPQATTPAKPLVKAKRKTLIGNSTLLASNGQWTLIPRGSVIHIPERLKSKVVLKPTGTLIEWKKFLIANHGWLHTHSIKMTQAQGKEKLKDDAMKAYKSMGKVIVATCSGGPISVAPISLLTEEEKEKAAAAEANQKAQTKAAP